MSETMIKVQAVHKKPTHPTGISIAAKSEKLLDRPIIREQAIVGKNHHNKRLILQGGKSVIAVRRRYPGQDDPECKVLETLQSKSVAIPAFVNKDGHGLFLQEEVRGTSLAHILQEQGKAAYKPMMIEALKKLVKIHRVGSRSGLDTALPGIGLTEDWRNELLGYPNRLGDIFGLTPDFSPSDDLFALLAVKQRRFIKWDTRPTKAILDGDSLVWVDWERTAARHRLDDMVWLLGDEAIPELPTTEHRLIETFLPHFADDKDLSEARDYFYAFGVFHICVRLGLMMRYKGEGDWLTAQKALKHPEVSYSREHALRLCIRGYRWSQKSTHTKSLVDWFKQLTSQISRD